MTPIQAYLLILAYCRAQLEQATIPVWRRYWQRKLGEAIEKTSSPKKLR